MPKVKQEKMRLHIDPLNDQAETIVHTMYDNEEHRGYSEKDLNRFSIKLPEAVASAMGKTEVVAHTQEKVREEFLAAIDKFQHLKKEVNRVILYRIDILPDENDHKPNWMHHSGYWGLEIKVWAGTFEETVSTAGNGEKRYAYAPVESTLDYVGSIHIDSRKGSRDEHQVPWTEANELFFKWVALDMKELIRRLGEIRDPLKMLAFIDAGHMLPLGDSAKKEIGA